MSGKSNIIEKIREKLMLASQLGQRGVILQPGAIGDCILTLPLAELMKETVCPGGIDIIGHTEYLGILPGRSCIDGVKSLESMSLHRLFASERDFDIADGDPMIIEFAGYSWIASFLGEPDSDFEKNLIFTVNCSHSAEVMTLAMKPEEGSNFHISEFYRAQFINQSGLSPAEKNRAIAMPLIRPTQADIYKGKEVLAENGIVPGSKPVVIHPGSGGAHKCWNLKNFLFIAGKIQQEGLNTVFLLGPAETEILNQTSLNEIRAAGVLLSNLSLTDVLAVLSCSRGFLGNDSGITHLAAAMGIKTIAVFGPTEPAVYAPIGSAVNILRNETADFTSAVSKDLQEKAFSLILAAS